MSRGSDKEYWHRYMAAYEEIFSRLPPAPKILEFGTYKGDSVRMLSALFPNSQIISADILPPQSSWPVGQNIKYVQLDQDNRNGLREALKKTGLKFDLVIEDGSHFPAHQRNALIETLPFLSERAFYVVEDLHSSSSQLRNFGHLSSSPNAFFDDNGKRVLNFGLRGLAHWYLARSRPKHKVNLLSLLLALERRLALGEKLLASEIDQLTRDEFFSKEEIVALMRRIDSVRMFRRSVLPLDCYNCATADFDLSLMRCRCGARIYQDDDSQLAVLEINSSRARLLED